MFGTSRLEAFSDGVMAVIITITALSLKAPNGTDFSALGHRLPALLVYILSFAFVGIYWNNHHHLLRATRNISGGVMWANLHLLFWLSLIPVITEWVGTAYRSTWPAATYGIVGLGAAIAFSILVAAIVRADGRQSPVATAIGSDLKGRLSLAVYAAGIGFAFLSPWISYALYASVSLMWFIPDRRLSRPQVPVSIVASGPVLSRGKGARRSGAPMDDPYDLERFVTAQNADGTYDRAVGELRRGQKMSHWMWFVFPQIAGLGRSELARRFAISSREEAQAYLHHPVLGPRLLECTGIVANTQGLSAEQIFGTIDAQKLRSSMTLFMRAAPAEPLFSQVIERYFDGVPDLATDE